MRSDREKFEAWLQRVAPRDAEPAFVGFRVECIGGPIDGMLTSIAEKSFRHEDAPDSGHSLYCPCFLHLTGPHGEVTRFEHRYQRDHRGAYVYCGRVVIQKAAR